MTDFQNKNKSSTISNFHCVSVITFFWVLKIEQKIFLFLLVVVLLLLERDIRELEKNKMNKQTQHGFFFCFFWKETDVNRKKTWRKKGGYNMGLYWCYSFLCWKLEVQKLQPILFRGEPSLSVFGWSKDRWRISCVIDPKYFWRIRK